VGSTQRPWQGFLSNNLGTVVHHTILGYLPFLISHLAHRICAWQVARQSFHALHQAASDTWVAHNHSTQAGCVGSQRVLIQSIMILGPVFHFLAHLFHFQDIPCYPIPYLSPATKSCHPKEYHVSSWTAMSPFKPIGCSSFIVLHHRLRTPQAILSHSIVLRHQQSFRKVPSTHCPSQ